jgi:4'-phosphopantetheinyl transferase
VSLHCLVRPRSISGISIWLCSGKLCSRLWGGASESLAEHKWSLVQLRFARRFYLKLLLGAYLGIPGKSVGINRSNRGKPVLDQSRHDCALHFSMAKSENRLLIGFSASGLVGVDLEPAHRRAHDALGVAGRYFSPAEARALERLDPQKVDQAFLRTWACKEAVVKASGEGIANQFARFSVETDLGLPPSVLEFENEDAAKWSLALLRPDDDFLAAVAVNQGQLDVRPFRLLPIKTD